ncbi:MAG: NifB/NifX family molybdenum-iron cluster-binding protein [Candidatus Marinimicrobia bacterium]|nr:NifB/NifX family molybdenum-iron cluster-binding protein [Candidatus Neomarinimicrobiota bacterium]
MKIAIAVESAELKVAKRMGHAPWFAIFEIIDEQFTLLKLASNEHAKDHEHEHYHEENNETEIENHQRYLAPLKGVDAMLSRAVGANMKEALARENIPVYRFPLSAGKTAPELIKFLIQNRDGLEDFKI